jgi:hypothetical protein
MLVPAAQPAKDGEQLLGLPAGQGRSRLVHHKALVGPLDFGPAALRRSTSSTGPDRAGTRRGVERTGPRERRHLRQQTRCGWRLRASVGAANPFALHEPTRLS